MTVPIADVGQAVRENSASGAVLVDLLVSPNAARFEVEGFDPWRKALRVRVAAKAQGGAANEALVRGLADRLSLPPSAVCLASGSTSRRKTVMVSGIARDELVRRLAARDV